MKLSIATKMNDSTFSTVITPLLPVESHLINHIKLANVKAHGVCLGGHVTEKSPLTNLESTIERRRPNQMQIVETTVNGDR